jgi:hypothetical protein
MPDSPRFAPVRLVPYREPEKIKIDGVEVDNPESGLSRGALKPAR